MSITASVLAIAGALAVGTISPGPSFVMVARTAVAFSRADGLAAAIGMGVGGFIFTLAALLGLQVVLTSVPSLYVAIKLCGGIYLAYLGIRIWRGAKQALVTDDRAAGSRIRTRKRSFLLGLTTQLSNPKTAIYYASIFAALMPREVPAALIVVMPIVMFLIESSWYAIVAYALSSASPRASYLRYKAWVDRTAGTVMVLLGIKLICSAKPV
jgi:threonine/homoserine/homoserine lactone efflux protein